jgi:acetyl esterase
MQPSDIPAPTVGAAAVHSAAYSIYYHGAAWVLRRLVAAMSGDGKSFDRRFEIATPTLGTGKISLSVCLPTGAAQQTEAKPCLLVLEGGGFILGGPNDGEALCRLLSDRV